MEQVVNFSVTEYGVQETPAGVDYADTGVG